MSDAWEAERTVVVPGADEGAEGDCPSVSAPYLCTRDIGHPGRHMAGVGGDGVVAAWPGDHEPTVADLTDGGAVMATLPHDCTEAERTETVEWWCRDVRDGREHRWPDEERAREHVASPPHGVCSLMRKTVVREVIVWGEPS